MAKLNWLGVCAAAALALSGPVLARGGGGHSSGGSHYVSPHVTKNGTYVQGHYQSNPNGTKSDNWSSSGNVNPYTGKEGTVDPLVPSKTSPYSLSAPSPSLDRQEAPFAVRTPVSSASPRPRSISQLRAAEASRGAERSGAMRAAFQKRSPCPSTGRTEGACPGYVVDHIQPLCANGQDLPSNMQWQTKAEAARKDGIERKACSKR